MRNNLESIFQKSKIKKVAEENLSSSKDLKYLIQYGSLVRDIDLLAVYSDEYAIKQKLICNGVVDINLMNESSFIERLNLYDIEITEPVVTGNLIHGDEDNYEKIKSIKKRKPSKKAIEHAEKRSLETFNSALFFYNRNKYKCNNLILEKPNRKDILLDNNLDFCTKDLLYVLNNLSFSLSYKLSAKHYSEKKTYVIFKEISKNYPLGDLMDYLKGVENGKQALTEKKTNYFIQETRNFLLNKS